MQITAIPCDAGCKNGLVFSFVTGAEGTCSTCDGEGMLYPCEAYSALGTNPAFRNQRCNTCGVRKNKHDMVNELREK